MKMTSEQWVRRLRKIGDDMDDAIEGVHPSAWPEILKRFKEDWHKINAAFSESEEPAATTCHGDE